MFKKLLLLVLAVAPLSLCAQKFAHFDYAAIIQAMPEAKAAQADLEALYKQYQAELENMQKELQTKHWTFGTTELFRFGMVVQAYFLLEQKSILCQKQEAKIRLVSM